MKRILVTACLLTFGCLHLPFIGKTEVQPLPMRLTANVKEFVTVPGNAGKVATEAKWIEEKVGIAEKAKQPADLDLIQSNVDNLISIAKDVKQTEDDWQTKYNDLLNSDEQKQKVVWLWVIGASALLVLAGSVIACVVDGKKGFGLGCSGILAYVVAFTMLKYGWVLALVGLAVFIGACALLVFELLKNKGVIVDLIRRFEFVKEKSFAEVKTDVAVFGDPKTNAVVKAVKARLGLDKPSDIISV